MVPIVSLDATGDEMDIQAAGESRFGSGGSKSPPPKKKMFHVIYYLILFYFLSPKIAANSKSLP